MIQTVFHYRFSRRGNFVLSPWGMIYITKNYRGTEIPVILGDSTPTQESQQSDKINI